MDKVCVSVKTFAKPVAPDLPHAGLLPDQGGWVSLDEKRVLGGYPLTTESEFLTMAKVLPQLTGIGRRRSSGDLGCGGWTRALADTPLDSLRVAVSCNMAR